MAQYFDTRQALKVWLNTSTQISIPSCRMTHKAPTCQASYTPAHATQPHCGLLCSALTQLHFYPQRWVWAILYIAIIIPEKQVIVTL